jgi:hypothetical protein
VLRLVEEYLCHVQRDTARAAWMAGDLLGEHWPLDQSLPSLRATAMKARYRAGREAALHGLSHALGRAAKRDQWSILETLKHVAAFDRSRKVRNYATSIMEDLRGL